MRCLDDNIGIGRAGTESVVEDDGQPFRGGFMGGGKGKLVFLGMGKWRRGRLVTALEADMDVVGLGVAIGTDALAEGVANDGVSFFLLGSTTCCCC